MMVTRRNGGGRGGETFERRAVLRRLPSWQWWIIKRRVENGIKSDKRPPRRANINIADGGIIIRQPFFSGE